MDYNCYRLRHNYRAVKCHCNEEKRCPPPPPPQMCCEEKFMCDMARAVGNMIQCMACRPICHANLCLCVKVLDERTRVPIQGAAVTVFCGNNIIAEGLTCERGLFRLDNLQPGCYTVRCGCDIQLDTVELNIQCPYIMLVCHMPSCNPCCNNLVDICPLPFNCQVNDCNINTCGASQSCVHFIPNNMNGYRNDF